MAHAAARAIARTDIAAWRSTFTPGKASTVSAATIALEISSRNARVLALQKRWDRLRAGLDLILDQRGADMATGR